MLHAPHLRAQARGHWTAILAALVPALEHALHTPGRHGPCPVHGGTDGFRLFRDVADTGGGICNTCGAFADGFALLGWLRAWPFPQVLTAVAGALGTTPPVPERGRPPAPARPADPRVLTALWAAARPLQDPAAWPLWRYLAHRGLTRPPPDLDPAQVRVHPRLGYYQDGRLQGHFPALLAWVCTPDGARATLHRTYLAPDGRGKAPVPAPRKLMAPLRPLVGGAIRLAPAGPALGVAEGIETALAARALSGEPVWAAVSATLLARFVPPPEVTRLTVWVDKDRNGAGQRAAWHLRERLARSHLTVQLRLPPGPIPPGAKGLDWAEGPRAGVHPAT